jgi:hypothetical protein
MVTKPWYVKKHFRTKTGSISVIVFVRQKKNRVFIPACSLARSISSTASGELESESSTSAYVQHWDYAPVQVGQVGSNAPLPNRPHRPALRHGCCCREVYDKGGLPDRRTCPNTKAMAAPSTCLWVSPPPGWETACR